MRHAQRMRHALTPRWLEVHEGAFRLITYRYVVLIPMPTFSRFQVSKLGAVQAPTSIQTNATTGINPRQI